jgi:hypothetical protein
MNYWPAENTNLAECLHSLFDFMEGLAINGAETARMNYSIESGWLASHNTYLPFRKGLAADAGCEQALITNPAKKYPEIVARLATFMIEAHESSEFGGFSFAHAYAESVDIMELAKNFPKIASSSFMINKIKANR